MERVVVNGLFLTRRVTGTERYAREMLRALCRLADLPFEVVVAAPAGRLIDPPQDVEIAQDRLPLPRWAWEQFRLPAMVKRLGGALLWSPANRGPLACSRQVVTIHDASVFAGRRWFSRAFAWYYLLLLPLLGRRAARILTDSFFSKSELIRWGIAEASRVDVIPGGVSETFRNASTTHADRRHVLFVGSRDPRKNLRRLLQAWQTLPSSLRAGRSLLLVGGSVDSFACEELGERPQSVECTGRVSDAELARLYANAEMLVSPSLYEGFGLPPLEAMAAGTPALISDIPVHREIFGAAAAYCDPLSVADIAVMLQRLLEDETLRASLRDNGLRLSARFTWESSALRLRDVFTKLLARRERPAEA